MNIPKLIQPSVMGDSLSGLADIAALTRSSYTTAYRLTMVAPERFFFIACIGTEFLPFELIAPAGGKIHRKLKAAIAEKKTTVELKTYNRHINGIKMPLVSEVYAHA